MSAIRALRGTAYASEHFEPENPDPQAHRRIRGQLEQIDYMAFACNREILAQTLKGATAEGFQRLAIATATARARWTAKALEITASGNPTPAQAVDLGTLRTAYEELAEVYEAMRRMVERGYLTYTPATQRTAEA
jgi:hypothetical protein